MITTDHWKELLPPDLVIPFLCVISAVCRSILLANQRVRERTSKWGTHIVINGPVYRFDLYYPAVFKTSFSSYINMCISVL